MTNVMDEHFRFFYEDNGFGPAEHVEPAEQSLLDAYAGILPKQMLEYWKTYGFASFGKGLFWTTNPSKYATLIPLWLDGTGLLERDKYAVVGRSGFGQLFLWGAKSGQCVKILCARGMIFPRDQSDRIAAGKGDALAQSFFSTREKRDMDQKDDDGKPLFDRALRQLGQLAPDEMYGFEPALALGGRANLVGLRKLKIVPHLTILAQLGERQMMRDIVQDAKRVGLVE